MIPRNRVTAHPGRILQEEFLEPLKISQLAFAKHIGVSFQTVNTLVNEKRGVSVEMAYLLADAFNMSPEFWLSLQMKHDLTSHRREKKIRPLTREKAVG
jgi:antitoxin HigA-1